MIFIDLTKVFIENSKNFVFSTTYITKTKACHWFKKTDTKDNTQHYEIYNNFESFIIVRANPV